MPTTHGLFPIPSPFYIVKMGCSCSRSYPQGSVPWAIQEVLVQCGYSRLTVLQINKALYPFAPPTDDYLSQTQLEAIANTLAVHLPAELCQQLTIDHRIKRKRVFFALILMSGDDEASKTAALYPFFGNNKREWVKFLEWREELLIRIVQKAVKMNYLDESEAKTALSQSIFPGNSLLLATSEQLWSAESWKQHLQDKHLTNFPLSHFNSYKK